MEQNFVVQCSIFIYGEANVKQYAFDKESEAISHLFESLNQISFLFSYESECTEHFCATASITLSNLATNVLLREINVTYKD